MVTKTDAGSNRHAVTYTRDDAGRVTRAITTGEPDDWTYAYDELDRLLSASNALNTAENQSFTYSAAGNMLSHTGRVYAYPAQGASGATAHADLGHEGQ